MGTPKRKGKTLRLDQRALEPYDIRLIVKRPLIPFGDIEDFILEIEGEIVCVAEDKSVPAGTIEACVIQVSKAIDARENLEEICDANSSELAEAYAALFDEGGELREEISDGGAWSDVLYLQRAEVLPPHRGRGVGLMAVLRLIEDFGSGCAIAAMKPFPLQLEGASDVRPRSSKDITYRRSLALDAFTQDSAVARPRLERYWNKLGFARVGNSNIFSLDLSLQRPGYSDLLKASR